MAELVPSRTQRARQRGSLLIPGRRLVVGIVLVAAVVVAVVVINPFAQPYSMDQIDHALDMIGPPPGFSGGNLVVEGGGFEGPQSYRIDYQGSAPYTTIQAWWGNRLRHLGLSDVNVDSDLANCQGLALSFTVSTVSAAYPLGGGPVTEVEVSAQSQGAPSSGGSCPSGLFN